MDLDEFETASSGLDSEDDDIDTEDDNLSEVSDSPNDNLGQDNRVNSPQVIEHADNTIESIEFEVDDEINSDFEDGAEPIIVPQASLRKLKNKNKNKKSTPAYSDDENDNLQRELSKLTSNLNGVALDDDSDWSTNPKGKKNKKKRNPTADSETASPQPQAALPKKKKYTESDDLPTHVPKGSDICVVCKELFTSRNKLFQHVKTTGHAAPLPQAKKGKKKRINLIYNNVHKYQLMSILNQFLIF